MTLAAASPRQLPAPLVDRALARYPLPVADAVAALVSADSLHEERDRVVEVFRATVRYLALLVLAARAQFGRGEGEGESEGGGHEPGEGEEMAELLSSLRRRGLTDGQWVALMREGCRPFARSPDRVPIAPLVRMLLGHGGRLPRLLDGLLEMRKSETVAHGATGDDVDIDDLLSRRMPQLADLLDSLEPLFEQARLCAPLLLPDGNEPQRARLLTGCTPPRGRFRRVDLASGVRMAPGELLLVDASGKPTLALHPLALFRRPSPEAHEEVFVLDGGGRRGALYVALPSMAEHVDREAWAQLDRALVVRGESPPAEEVDGARRPYRGLESFGPEHASLFFGREEQAEALAARVRKSPIVTVTGPSGSGKSSLLSAGVVPLLEGFTVVRLRPGADPAAALARRLARQLSEEEGDAEAIASVVRRTPEAAAHAIVRYCEGRAQRLLLLVDQAEELFTLCPDHFLRESFARALATAAAEPDGPVRLALVVREDFFARLATIEAWQGLYSRAVEVVTTPGREALRRTLVLPARRFGYAFEDEALVDRMVDAAQGAPAALGLLQFCADRLWDARDRRWKRITHDAYHALGGVVGALAAHAEKTLRDLTPSQQEAARAILLRLVTAEGTRALAGRAELLSACGSAPDALVVLERLVEARLVVAREAEGSQSEASFELVHEALLRHWERLSSWLDEDREGQRRVHALRQAAREWQTRGRPRGLLWRDEILAEHRLFFRTSRTRLTELEAEFLDESSADERRGQRLRRGLVSGALALLAAFAAVMAVQWREAVVARRAADEARELTAKALRQSEVGRLLAEAGRREFLGLPGDAIALLRAAIDSSDEGSDPPRAAIAEDLSRLASLGELGVVFRGDPALVQSLAFSPDGERLVAVTGSTAWVWQAGRVQASLPHDGALLASSLSPDGSTLATVAADGRLRLWSASSGKRLAQADHRPQAHALAFSPDGKLLASASIDGRVRLFDARTAAGLREIDAHDGPALALAFSPDGLTLATGGHDKLVKAWSASSWKLLSASRPLDDAVSLLAFSPDGQRLAALHKRAASVLDGRTLGPLARLEGHDHTIYGLSFSPDGARIATASSDKTGRLWDGATGKHLATLAGHERALYRVAFSPDGALLATASTDGTTRLWDGKTGALLRALRGHQGGVSALAFSPDGSRLATGSRADDGVVRVWELSSGARPRPLRGHGDDVYAVAFSPDGSRLATSSKDRTARLWDARSGSPIATLEHREQVYAVDFSPDGSTLATAALDRQARLWDAATGKLLHTLSGHQGYLPAVAFSPDGKLLATASVDRQARLFDPATGQLVRTLSAHDGAVFALAFDRRGERLATLADDNRVVFWDTTTGLPRGSTPAQPGYAEAWARAPQAGRLAFGGADGSATVWDVDRGEAACEVRGHPGAVLSVALSRDGSRLATGSTDPAVKVWDVATGRLVRALSGHGGGVLALAFSPDGRLLATGSADRSIRVYQLDAGELVSVLAGHEDKVSALAFSPDGAQLASASHDDTARLWPIDPEPPRETPLRSLGARTNLRVCRQSFEVVAVLPFPDASSVWAPEALCPAR